MTSPADVGPGHRVAGRYLLVSRLGGGGMGAVWLATDERLHRQVAVKQLVLPVGSSAEAAAEQRARTMREGRIAARVSHPHAIGVYDVVDHGGSPWLVMEYLPSRSLAEVLADDGVLPVRQVAQIGAQLADALVATHAAGIVHRDVKPGNVLVGAEQRIEGLVKLTDFGISHAQGDVRLTQTGMVTGTPAFFSPEVARGEDAGHAGDVWSLGATLFTALEGEPPFGTGSNSLEMLHRVAGGRARAPVRSGALTPVLERMLAVDPAQRPTMSAVRDELAAVAAGDDGDVTEVLTARTPLRPAPPVPRQPTRTDLPATPVPPSRDQPRSAPPTAPPPPRTSVTPAPTGRRSRGPAVAIAVVVLLALVGAGGWWVSRDDGAGGTAADPAASTSASSAGAPTGAPTGATTAPSTTAPTTTVATTTAAPTTDPEVVTAAEVSQAITDYYALLPGDPETAYELTGPTLQEASSRGNYRSFWKRFDDVVLGPVTATDGSLVATGQVTFVEDDETQVEQHEFTLVEGPDGTLLMDRDVAV